MAGIELKQMQRIQRVKNLILSCPFVSCVRVSVCPCVSEPKAEG